MRDVPGSEAVCQLFLIRRQLFYLQMTYQPCSGCIADYKHRKFSFSYLPRFLRDRAHQQFFCFLHFLKELPVLLWILRQASLKGAPAKVQLLYLLPRMLPSACLRRHTCSSVRWQDHPARCLKCSLRHSPYPEGRKLLLSHQSPVPLQVRVFSNLYLRDNSPQFFAKSPVCNCDNCS